MRKRRLRSHFRCECGRLKPSRKIEACEHCRYLDGSRAGAREIIAVFRTIDSKLSVGEIIAETGLSYSNATYILKRLVRDGRARRLRLEVTRDDNDRLRTGIYYELISAEPARAAL